MKRVQPRNRRDEARSNEKSAKQGVLGYYGERQYLRFEAVFSPKGADGQPMMTLLTTA